ncbi:MAG: TIGR03905 family TSCPD domain-containing protein [Clostridia bacterium]|nr:TIGR03905 family TSCPD domain-containing protein [Clostridia bacterium]
MTYTYRTKGTCSSQITFELDGNIVKKVQFIGGCNGNLKAIASLVEGMTVEEIAKRCEGITCGFKSTSCSDQLVKALKEAVNQK